jgi:predicted alpha/beta hydrolase family esterase
MAHDLDLTPEQLRDEPLILIVPGINNSNADHWQSRWQAKRDDCRRVDLGMWDNPHRNTWVNKLNLEIHRAGRPVVLVAHSLGCLTVAWWAEYEQPTFGNPVVGALLVAPPDVDRPGTDPRLARFGACPRSPLPFPAFLAASHDDGYCSFRTAIALARDWNCRFADAGAVGHINAQSGLGDWDFGELLLKQLLREHRLSHRDEDVMSPPQPHAFAARSAPLAAAA